MDNKELTETLKKLSKFVCIELCYKSYGTKKYDSCKKCPFPALLNSLLDHHK